VIAELRCLIGYGQCKAREWVARCIIGRVIEPHLVWRIVKNAAVDLPDIVGCIGIRHCAIDKIILTIGIGHGGTNQSRSLKEMDGNTTDAIFTGILNAVIVGIAPDPVSDLDRRGIRKHYKAAANATGFSENIGIVADTVVESVGFCKGTGCVVQPAYPAVMDHVRYIWDRIKV